jgi:Papain family cysteine protease
MPNRAYGWKRGLPSRQFPKLELAERPALPAKATVEMNLLPAIWDQGATGSCTGHGTARALMFARAKQGLPFLDLSRLFPYYNARVAEGTQGQDSGAVIADVIAASQRLGDCPYIDLPTEVSLVTVPPTQTAIAAAIQHKALTATRVWGADSAGLAYHVKHCISQLGLPVVFGFTVYQSFESDAVAKSGIVPMPGQNEQVLGGHCVVAVGYNDETQMVECDNSWGDGWGIGGTFQMPYAYIFDSDMADDFHAVEVAG